MKKEGESKEKSRVKYAVGNSLASIFFSVTGMLLHFIIRRFFVYAFGLEVLGYNATFNSVFGMLNLAELGVGTAITYKLYEPIAKKDNKTVNAYIYLYRGLYRGIGLFVLAVGLCIVPILPIILKSTYDKLLYLAIIYCLQLMSTVTTYFFSYRRIILTVEQRNYVNTAIDWICLIVTSGLQLICMVWLKNYYLYLLVLIFQVVISNLIISSYCRCFYPQFYAEKSDNLEFVKTFLKDLKNVIMSKVGGYVLNSTDALVVSVMLGSDKTGLMENYRSVFISFQNMVLTAFNAISASLGNKIFCEKDAGNIEKVILRLTFVAQVIGSIFASVAFTLMDNFIMLWLNGNYLLDANSTFFFSLNVYVFILMYPISLLFGALGYFNYDKKYVALSAVVNVVLSVIMVYKWGIAGVLLGTTVALLVYWSTRLIILYRVYFKCTVGRYLKVIVRCVATVSLCFIVNIILRRSLYITGWFSFVGVGMVYCLIDLSINMIMFCKSEELFYYMSKIRGILKR